MDIVFVVSECIIPVLILSIVLVGATAKHSVYEEFTEGSKKGLKIVVELLPSLIGLLVAVGMLRASGLLEDMCNVLGQWTERINFPSAVLPVTMVKLFSASAATGLMLDIFSSFGVDSYEGRLVALILSSTETLMYTVSIYFMAINVTKTKWTIPAALISVLSGVIASWIIAAYFWK